MQYMNKLSAAAQVQLVNTTMTLSLRSLCLDFDPFSDEEKQYDIKFRDGNFIFREGERSYDLPTTCRHCGVRVFTPGYDCSSCICKLEEPCKFCDEPAGLAGENTVPLCFSCYCDEHDTWREE